MLSSLPKNPLKLTQKTRWPWTPTAMLGFALFMSAAVAASEPPGQPLLYRKIAVPAALLPAEGFVGDVRIGDFDGDRQADFLLFRSTDGGAKPCYLAAFTMEGKVLWEAGAGGEMPMRPGSVTVYDITGDGIDDVICIFAKDPSRPGNTRDLSNAVLQIRDGKSGKVLRENAPREIAGASCPEDDWRWNWVHQRILVANFRGTDRPRDFVVKLGMQLVAFDERLETLWTYETRWRAYGGHSSYIPAVGDLDGDGRDEVTGGYYIVNADGTPRWEGMIGPHMDSVGIQPWDNGRMRVLASGGGHILDAKGGVVLSLGKEVVPHGQEARIADFLPDHPGPEMILRFDGHKPQVMTVANDGKILHRFDLNVSPNNTGMEAIHWGGKAGPSLLYNGGVLWQGDGRRVADLPGLPPPLGTARRGWYHCIPADVCSDAREEVVLFNPWDRHIWIYTASPMSPSAFSGYRTTARQYNVRLMD